jgi:hypothetical protein
LFIGISLSNSRQTKLTIMAISRCQDFSKAKRTIAINLKDFRNYLVKWYSGRSHLSTVISNVDSSSNSKDDTKGGSENSGCTSDEDEGSHGLKLPVCAKERQNCRYLTRSKANSGELK